MRALGACAPTAASTPPAHSAIATRTSTSTHSKKMESKRCSARIAAAREMADNHRLLREMLRHKPYAYSSVEEATGAWNEIRETLGKQKDAVEIEEQYRRLYEASRKRSRTGGQLDATTRQLLADIQGDVAHCSSARHSSPQRVYPHPPADDETASEDESTEDEDSHPPAKVCKSSVRAPIQKTVLIRRTAKRPSGSAVRAASVEKPRPRRQPSTPTRPPSAASSEESKHAASFEESEDSDDEQILVGPHVLPVVASPQSQPVSSGRASAVFLGEETLRMNMRLCNERLAIAERETSAVLEVMNAIVASQRERFRLAAEASSEIFKLD